MFTLLRSIFRRFGQEFFLATFIYGPQYTVANRDVHILLNFISGQAKLAIWLSRKNKIKGEGSDNIVLIMTGLIKTRIKVEFEYSKLTDNLEKFMNEWCVKDALTSVTGHCLTFNF